jgi:hypothetical protein
MYREAQSSELPRLETTLRAMRSQQVPVVI